MPHSFVHTCQSLRVGSLLVCQFMHSEAPVAGLPGGVQCSMQQPQLGQSWLYSYIVQRASLSHSAWQAATPMVP